MRRTLSISAMRSIAGTAHSSPMRELGDLLERGDEQLHVRAVDARLGVADQRDRDLVDARIARQRAARELGQLAVVARAAGSRAPRGCAPRRRGSCRGASRRPDPRRSPRPTPRGAACTPRTRPAGSRPAGSAAESAACLRRRAGLPERARATARVRPVGPGRAARRGSVRPGSPAMAAVVRTANDRAPTVRSFREWGSRQGPRLRDCVPTAHSDWAVAPFAPIFPRDDACAIFARGGPSRGPPPHRHPA